MLNSKQNPLRQSIFLLLKEIRTEANLTQLQLAQKLGRHQSFVSKYESGERRLDILELKEVCEAVGTSFIDIARKIEGI